MLRIDNIPLPNASLGMPADQDFEWTFVVPEITGPDDPRIDALNDRGDSVVESHGGLNLVTLLVSGRTAIRAAQNALVLLDECGLKAARSYPDLCTRGDIAERTGMERQTVDHWIRGQRRKGFPNPVHLAGRGLWLWHDVIDWLIRENVGTSAGEDGVGYPTLPDHAAIDNQLQNRLVLSSKVAFCSSQTSLSRLATLPKRRLVGAGT